VGGDLLNSSASPRKRHALDLFAGLPARYDRMGALLSFGQDPRWRRALVAAIDPQPGQRVLDVACGTGLVTFALAAVDGVEVVGLDQSEDMLAGARGRAGSRTGTMRFVRGEAEDLPFADGEFDAVTFTYLLRYVDDVPATLRELVRVVRPGGTVAMLEFGLPRGPSRPFWELYMRVGLPALGAVVSPEWGGVGRFLGPSIRGFWRDWPEPRLLDAWRAAGLADVAARRLSLGGGIVVWGTRA
jgi:demethylmenaquinone methyltransferase/2-methoxy-6-polyprenyl-1,4-benzoquinol methylase